MNKDILKYSNEFAQVVASMQILFSEKWKEHFAEMATYNFEEMDLDSLNEQQEQQFRSIYNISLLVLSLDGLPAHIIAAFENIKKCLYPLFEDATTYLTQEPNNTVLLNSISQYEVGKAREISFL